ncbi:MADS-box transcription factor 13-like isoform X2 [Panicum virgatum]|uniref:MADS-box transcription factor 13-like isoform X2 n=1 Tax=Panicum virgatum TaxID=38727 RepID=UPI0019D50126|nr:MADS-box transcription factor 13-like isoform X2 [Panicum virgatum]
MWVQMLQNTNRVTCCLQISFWLILFGFIPLHQILLKLQETELQNDHMNLRTKIEEGEQQLQQVTVARSAATQVQS